MQTERDDIKTSMDSTARAAEAAPGRRRPELNGLDTLLLQFDRALRTLSTGASQPRRSSPGRGTSPAGQGAAADGALSEEQARHAAGLMRVNHTGEVCAQALYQGQALTARLPGIRQSMETAAAEEIDHLAWCEERLQELNSRGSYLNPAWYALSFGLGAGAGALGDRWSLGFVAETEEQVCRHLEAHLDELPKGDEKSRRILDQMLVDEKKHGQSAREAGGSSLPAPVRQGMHFMSSVMKKLSYRI